MKLLSLRLENFRSFERCELDLNRDGLIGISGPNGAGKSTLLEAINYALYGRGRGSRTRRPERDGMQSGEACEVELEFLLQDRHHKVLRGPRKVLLEVDGQPMVSDGQEALTERVTEALGVGQLNFAMTFYARQREIQALDPADNRRTAQLEALLGIDRVRNAVDAAREAVREQDALVRGVESTLSPLAEARTALEAVEEEAARSGPEVEQTTEKREEAAEARSASWTVLTEARERAEEAFAIEARVQVAAAELESAREKVETTNAALSDAASAAAELVKTEPLAAKAEELAAQNRALELERQASEHAQSLRDKRHQAEVAAVAAAERLAADPNPGPPLEETETALLEKRSRLEAGTVELLAASKRDEEVRGALDLAAANLKKAKRAVELEEELGALRPIGEKAQEWSKRRAALEAESAQLRRQIAEEREHFSHLKEDGPKATCPRCKRAYEGDYRSIVKQFENALAALEAREAEIAEEISQLDGRLSEAAPKLDRLRGAEGERAVLDPPAEDLASLGAIFAAAEGEAGELAATIARLSAERDTLAEEIAVLDGKIGPLREALAARKELVAGEQSARRDREIFHQQLSEVSPNGYQAEDHAELRSALAKALAAKEHCAALRVRAEQHELLAARLQREQESVVDCERTHGELSSAALKRAPDKSAQERAEAEYEAKDEALAEAERLLAEAKRKAIVESNAVAEARTALERAQQQRGRLETERREGALRRMVLAALESYRAAIQQEAVPSLEQETADLLRRLTRGRYSDVQISDRGELRISDRGEPHELGRFSGGEQDVANLCMRIALSKVLARRSGAEANFIVLDEVFGSQDQDRRSALVEALRELDQEFAQVLVVSHVGDFMEHCDLKIAVEAVDGISRADLEAQ